MADATHKKHPKAGAFVLVLTLLVPCFAFWLHRSLQLRVLVVNDGHAVLREVQAAYPGGGEIHAQQLRPGQKLMLTGNPSRDCGVRVRFRLPTAEVVDEEVGYLTNLYTGEAVIYVDETGKVRWTEEDLGAVITPWTPF